MVSVLRSTVVCPPFDRTYEGLKQGQRLGVVGQGQNF